MVDRLSQKSMGFRVKHAREAKGWTQEQLTEALGLNDRQTVSDVENGKRALRPDELVRLTEVLDRDLDFFLDPFALAGEAQFSWRAAPEVPEENLDQFESKAGRFIGLLRWLRETEHGATNPLKHTLRLTAQSSFEDAQESGERLARMLDLGGVPAERLIERVEEHLDIPVLFVDTADPSEEHSISGATCHLDDLRVILVARNESEGRRFYDLAHELFHALTWDAMEPDHRESNSFEERVRVKRVEQLANNFAAALLMPRASLEHLLDRRRLSDVAHLAQAAAQLRVAPTALAWRLYNLKWIGDDVRRALMAERQRTSIGTPKRFSPRFVEMLQRAIDRGRLSARKAAKAMEMNLSQLADLFGEHGLPVPFEL